MLAGSGDRSMAGRRSEIADLVSICVEVDRAIADDPAGRSRVASVLPVDAAELEEAFRGGRAGRLDGMAEHLAVDEALGRLADVPALGALATSRSLGEAAWRRRDGRRRAGTPQGGGRRASGFSAGPVMPGC